MKAYNRLMILTIFCFAAAMLAFNLLHVFRGESADRLYNVEINRLMERFLSGEPISYEASEDYERVTAVEFLPADASRAAAERFYADKQYAIRPIYRDGAFAGNIKFSYMDAPDTGQTLLWQNAALFLLFFCVLSLLLYLRVQIIRPMNVFSSLPAALAKGDFTTPVRAQRGQFFGRFLWGLDMLRQTLASERQRTLALEKEKSSLALSLSHDIRTPLNAILLCSKALQEGLYSEPEKQNELLQKIDVRSREIERLVGALQRGVSEELWDLPVNQEEFYLSDIVVRAEEAYRWQMELAQTEFIISPYSNCLVLGDADRAFEAVCNILENAVKYGDGKRIVMRFSREENCRLITISNTGNTLPNAETVHLFESFWRGSNAAGKPGNGLGLFIARQLAVKMGGEAFAEPSEDEMNVTLVFRMA